MKKIIQILALLSLTQLIMTTEPTHETLVQLPPKNLRGKWISHHPTLKHSAEIEKQLKRTQMAKDNKFENFFGYQKTLVYVATQEVAGINIKAVYKFGEKDFECILIWDKPWLKILKVTAHRYDTSLEKILKRC